MPMPLQQLIALGRLRPFRNAYLLRGAAVWMGARIALAWGEIVNPGLPTESLILGVVGLAVWMDARRRAEDVFLGNLGIPSWTIAALAVPMALLAEVIVP